MICRYFAGFFGELCALARPASDRFSNQIGLVRVTVLIEVNAHCMGIVRWVKGSSPLLWLKNGRCHTGEDRSICKKIEEEELLVEKILFLSASSPENGELSSSFLDTYPRWAEFPRGDRFLPMETLHFSLCSRAGFAIDHKTRSPKYGQLNGGGVEHDTQTTKSVFSDFVAC